MLTALEILKTMIEWYMYFMAAVIGFGLFGHLVSAILDTYINADKKGVTK
jgi:hypothetical protein